MPRIIMLGAPGSGKGTLAAMISQQYNIPTISTGDILRANLAAGAPLGKEAEAYMNAGKLVPDELIIKLVREVFEKEGMQSGFLFDGFPRTINQAEALDALLQEKEMGLEKVFFLNVPKELIIERISNRQTCPSCNTSYNKIGRSPNVEGVCDKCGAALVQREDDDPVTVGKRIDVYNEQTGPLVDYYAEQGKLAEIDGTQEVDEKMADINSVLGAA